VLDKVPMVNGKGEKLGRREAAELFILKIQEQNIEDQIKKDVPPEVQKKITKQLSDVYYFRPSTSPNKNKSNLATFQFNHTYVVNAKNSWTNGIQFFNKSIRSNDRGNHEHLHAGVFSIMTHKLSSKVVLTESIRGDWDESYKWVMVPQINFSWSPSKLTVRASGGKSIRDADFTERYNNYNKTLVTAGSIGNPDLQAEKAWNWEAGIDYNFSSFVQVRTTYFQRDQQNLIDWISTPYSSMPRKVNLSSTGTYGLASNLSSVNTRGFEIDFTGSKKVTEKVDIRWMSGMVWLNSKTPAGGLPSFYLSSHATFIWNGSVQINLNKTSLSISSLYKERNEQKASSINATITPNYFFDKPNFLLAVIIIISAFIIVWILKYLYNNLTNKHLLPCIFTFLFVLLHIISLFACIYIFYIQIDNIINQDLNTFYTLLDNKKIKIDLVEEKIEFKF
jgi:outer membrane cobalamin receptor